MEPSENSLFIVENSVSRLVVISIQESSSMDVQDARRRAASRLRTARGVAVEEAAFFSVLKPGTHVALSYVDDPDVWHEALVTWPSLGADRAAAILTPDGDHHVELTAGANAGPLWIGLCDSGGDCDIVRDGSFYRFRSRLRGAELPRILAEGRGLLEAQAGAGTFLFGRRRAPEVPPTGERPRGNGRRSRD